MGLLHGREMFTWAADVEGVYLAGGIGEAYFCEAETDTLVCASD